MSNCRTFWVSVITLLAVLPTPIAARTARNSVSCRADIVYSCSSDTCVANFNENDLDFNFKSGAATLCLAVFCTVDGKVSSQFLEGRQGRRYRSFIFKSTTANNGVATKYELQGAISPNGKSFHMRDVTTNDIYHGTCK